MTTRNHRDLPETPEELSEELLRSLVALVRHPRLKNHVQQRASDLGPTALTDEATRLSEAEKSLLQDWRPGTSLSELRILALERIADLIRVASEELVVLDVLADDGETLRSPQLLLRRSFCLLVSELERLPFDLFLGEEPCASPGEGDTPRTDGEPDWVH